MSSNFLDEACFSSHLCIDFADQIGSQSSNLASQAAPLPNKKFHHPWSSIFDLLFISPRPFHALFESGISNLTGVETLSR